MTDVAGHRCPPASVAELDRLMVAVETIAASHGPTRTTEPPYPREACRSWHNHNIAIDRLVGRGAPGQGRVKR